MYQGSKSVEDYHKDMEDIVERYHYTSLDDLVHQAIRVEAQQKRHLTLKKPYPNGPNN
ncbi:hypothetical protein CR513_46858, partial [Mucuna pruriens]